MYEKALPANWGPETVVREGPRGQTLKTPTNPGGGAPRPVLGCGADVSEAAARRCEASVLRHARDSGRRRSPR